MVLSVIIVTYNNEKEIGPCLASVKTAAKAYSHQIIVIDNHSQDRTQLSIQQTGVHIEFIANQKNHGFTRAVNQGLLRANGEYILLLNPDTELPASVFKILLPLFEHHTEPGILAPQFLNADGSIQPSCRRFPRHRDVFYHASGLSFLFPRHREFNHWKMGDFDHREERFVEQPQGAFLLIRRSVLKSIGQLDECFPMFFSDVDFCRRCINSGWKILFTPGARIIHHRGRSINRNRIPLIWSSHLSFYRYFRKYYRIRFWKVINAITGMTLIVLAIARIIVYMIGRRR